MVLLYPRPPNLENPNHPRNRFLLNMSTFYERLLVESGGKRKGGKQGATCLIWGRGVNWERIWTSHFGAQYFLTR